MDSFEPCTVDIDVENIEAESANIVVDQVSSIEQLTDPADKGDADIVAELWEDPMAHNIATNFGMDVVEEPNLPQIPIAPADEVQQEAEANPPTSIVPVPDPYEWTDDVVDQIKDLHSGHALPQMVPPPLWVTRSSNVIHQEPQ